MTDVGVTALLIMVVTAGGVGIIHGVRSCRRVLQTLVIRTSFRRIVNVTGACSWPASRDGILTFFG